MSRQGSVRRDAKTGAWYFVLDARAAGAAERKQVRRRGFKTKAEAVSALDELKRALATNTYVAPTRQTLAEYLGEWLEAIRPTVKPSTHYSYERNLRLHVVPRIGDCPLQALDAGQLNRLYADLLREGHASGGDGLSMRTVRYIHTILHRALKDAVKWGRIVRNPSDAADPPRASAATPPRIVTWPAETLREFLTHSRGTGDRYHALWTLLATTGMRRGEALGLRWHDVDLQNGTASIVQTVVVVNHVPMLSTPKTARGTRLVDLDDGTIAALRSHRARQHQERLLMGEGWKDHDLLFCKVDGEPLHPERVSREFQRRIERWSLPPLTVHGLRHTWATLALKAGVNAKVVQERLGHATIGITLGTYSHVTAGMQREAADKVAGLILGR